MHHTPLALVKDRVVAGQPLPFNVYRPDATLLLARGQVVQSPQQLDALFERGSLVDLNELRGTAADIANAPREQLPGLWRDAVVRAAQERLTVRP